MGEIGPSQLKKTQLKCEQTASSKPSGVNAFICGTTMSRFGIFISLPEMTSNASGSWNKVAHLSSGEVNPQTQWKGTRGGNETTPTVEVRPESCSADASVVATKTICRQPDDQQLNTAICFTVYPSDLVVGLQAAAAAAQLQQNTSFWAPPCCDH